MSTYNFTVRAEDDRGAFSDRTFSIQVQNNLVDRIAVIDQTNLYASVDGVNWTTRTGKGGSYVYHLLGKWVVIKSPTVYITSKDTINWDTFNFTTKKIVDSEDTTFSERPFLIDLSTLFEHGGVVYSIGKLISGASDTINKTYVFKTTDLVSWEPIVESNEAFGGGAIATIYPTSFSNIVRYKNQFLFYNSITKRFVTSDDFKTFKYHDINNIAGTPLAGQLSTQDNVYAYISMVRPTSTTRLTQAVPFTTMKNIRLVVINDVVQLHYMYDESAVASNKSSGSTRDYFDYRRAYSCGVYYTTDLNNINEPLLAGTRPAMFNKEIYNATVPAISSTTSVYGWSQYAFRMVSDGPTSSMQFQQNILCLVNSKPASYINGSIFSAVQSGNCFMLDNPLSISQDTRFNNHATVGYYYTSMSMISSIGHTSLYRPTSVLFNGYVYGIRQGYLMVESGRASNSFARAKNGTANFGVVTDIAVRK